MQDKNLWQHLEELRGCLLKSLIGLGFGVALAFAFISSIFKFLSAPYVSYLTNTGLPASQALKSLSPPDTFSITLKASVLFGLCIASPWIFYQLWSFISPGLYKHEKKYIIPFCTVSVAFFFLGLAFAYFVVLPMVIGFFYNYSVRIGVMPEWTIGGYFNFVITFLASFGIVFELPIAIAVLAWFGIVSSKWLAAYRRHAIVVILIVAAILTPPDFISQLTMTVPMVILYEVSILASKLIERARYAPQAVDLQK